MQQQLEDTAPAPVLPENRCRPESRSEAESDGELRVTPEEVALAASALEAKRDAEHIWRNKTLPLNEAIHHLGLDATPQELAPEVVALRKARTPRDANAFMENLSRCTVAQAVVATVIVLGTGGLFLLSYVAYMSHFEARHQPPAAVPAAMTTLPIQKLSVVAENVPVHIDADTLLSLAKGDMTPESVSVDTRTEAGGGAQVGTMFNNEWTIVKSHGDILVSGWATAEFALNISNDSTGAIFSSRPGWLPANNLVPLQVPLYRLEGQSSARYHADGNTTDATSSVLMAVNVARTSKAVDDLVQDALTRSGDNFSANTSEGYSYVVPDLQSEVLHLTGNATTAALKMRATEIAKATLKRLNLSYTISNDLKVDSSR